MHSAIVSSGMARQRRSEHLYVRYVCVDSNCLCTVLDICKIVNSSKRAISAGEEPRRYIGKCLGLVSHARESCSEIKLQHFTVRSAFGSCTRAEKAIVVQQQVLCALIMEVQRRRGLTERLIATQDQNNDISAFATLAVDS